MSAPPTPTATTARTLLARIVPLRGASAARASTLVERSVLLYRRSWLLLVSGFFEPLFYLLSIGVGLGGLVGTIEVDGRVLDYTVFVAPALMASAAMNGAIYDSTFNIFFKLKYARIYDAILATPMTPPEVALGEIAWALLRGLLYSTAFLLVMTVMGLVGSPWMILAPVGAGLIGFGFAAAGMAASSYLRTWADFEFVQLAIMPMFLFATTFFPLSTYPQALQVVVTCLPLYHAIELLRELNTGAVGLSSLGHVAYLAVMGLLGLSVASRRLRTLLLK